MELDVLDLRSMLKFCLVAVCALGSFMLVIYWLKALVVLDSIQISCDLLLLAGWSSRFNPRPQILLELEFVSTAYVLKQSGLFELLLLKLSMDNLGSLDSPSLLQAGWFSKFLFVPAG